MNIFLFLTPLLYRDAEVKLCTGQYTMPLRTGKDHCGCQSLLLIMHGDLVTL